MRAIVLSLAILMIGACTATERGGPDSAGPAAKSPAAQTSAGRMSAGRMSPGRMSAAAAMPRAAAAAATQPALLSNLHHPVSTKSPNAQRHFDNGLTLIYAFNHDEAVREFEKALAADPDLAMAHWGIALALGPNYNLPVDAEREKKAYDHVQQAAALAEKNASQAEKDYIAALAKRFSNADKPDLEQLARDYAAAASELAKKHPDDLDAATLSADARMNLRPWQLWTKDYKPAEGTEAIVATLQEVLRRDPDHLGACHLYIHAVEASHQPERALEAAARLPGLAPECGHLVHMPSHIYARVGDPESAATSNEAAVDADRAYFKANPDMAAGFYGMMYYPHNMHFLAYAQAWQGNYAESKKWAKQLYDHAAPHVAHMPMLEAFTDVPTAVDIKFRRWDDLIGGTSPDEKTMPITAALWHFGRGLAYADKGDVGQASAEREKMLALADQVPADAMLGMVNKARDVLKVAQLTLDGKLAAADQQWPRAVQSLRSAAAAEDGLNYMEPPDWLCPTREALGGVLLRSGDAAGAEKVFREALDLSPRSGRALFGLWKSLEAQGKQYDADIVRRQFESAWKNADSKLTVEQL